MIASSFLVLSLVFSSGVQALPLQKRIAQVISASTAQWEKACIAAGGAQKCNPVSITAFSTLLAAPGPCEQQNAADQMIDLAKQLGNDADMVRLAQIFAQQPRNSPSSQSVPYCQQAPKNSELNGLFQCQFAGSDKKTFVGGIAAGQTGTIPFGLNALPNPAGSCPAHPDGPVPDGSQLVDIVKNPGTGNANPGNSNNSSGGGASGNNDNNSTPSPSPSSTASGSSSTSGGSSPGSGGFKLQNGKDAQALNAKFSSLTANSACQTGDQACIGGTDFAQCVNGKFVGTKCSGGLGCFALPLVNKAGTSIACTTQADAEARIAASGATGGLTGSGSSSGTTTGDSTSSSLASPVPSSNNAAAAPSGGFKLQNGKDAQALNAKFATLTTSSSCNLGDNACVNGGFAQCVGGKFAVTQCSGGLTCAALPLVNSPGTSIACTTQADAEARIAATGATGGFAGTGTSSGNSVKTNTATSTTKNNVAAVAPSNSGGFKLQNGKDSQALNAKFATLNANSSCKAGENACVNGGFAQCVNGKFVVTPCSGGLTCAALPLVNSAGTSIACTTKADAAARIAATGATGGITGA